MGASSVTGSVPKSALTSKSSCSSSGAPLATSSANETSGNAQRSALQLPASQSESSSGKNRNAGASIASLGSSNSVTRADVTSGHASLIASERSTVTNRFVAYLPRVAVSAAQALPDPVPLVPPVVAPLVPPLVTPLVPPTPPVVEAPAVPLDPPTGSPPPPFSLPARSV